ncbi:PfkB family carbohydrate kinase [Escherichia coli]|nr:PfkB family carbohydrate kinase [Escherichia coli]
MKTAFRLCHHRCRCQSTVGAGDSMVGAMTLKPAENASLEEMVRGVAAGECSHYQSGTRLCSQDDTQKFIAFHLSC